MDTSPPIAFPSPYPSRRGWLIAFGIIEILMACGFLLVLFISVFALLGPGAANMPPGAMSSGPLSRTAIMALVGLQYLVLTAVFLAAGIGSIRCRNWARILMLVTSGLWLGLGLLGTLMMAFVLPAVMRSQPGNISQGFQQGIVVGMIASMSVFMVFLPAAFLFFYTRKSVRATCLAQSGVHLGAVSGEGSAARGLPVPLAILVVWEALSAFSVFAILIMPVAFLFGVVLHGMAASFVLLTHSLLSAYAAWTIFRQQLIGWQVSLFKTGFWTISMLVSAARHPDMTSLFRDMGYNDQTLIVYQQFPQFMPVMLVAMTVMMAAIIIFLLYARRFFPDEAPA
jgi:hypothetical protein